MTRKTFTEVLAATRQAFIENLTLQSYYGYDSSLTWDEIFSKSSFEGALTYVFSFCVWIFQNDIYDTADEITASIASEHEFSIPWYTGISKYFQLGDSLVYDESTYKYAYSVIDESKQIVKFTTIRERQIEGVTKLQVFATKAEKAAMTVDELAAFSGYITQRGAAGTHFQFISLAPDQLVLNMTVYYDPQILKANGEKLSDGTKTVDIAVNAYLDAILYGGKFNRTKQTDKIQVADGVNDVVLGDVYLNGDLNNSREFESASGFYVAQTITVTYIPNYAN